MLSQSPFQAVMDYKADLNQRYWQYQKSKFSNERVLFERVHAPDGRPPVFIRSESWRNVIINPDASEQEKGKLLALVFEGERHKWFGSMNSSQALAQSIFGNLATHGFLQDLSELKDDEGMDLFGKTMFSSNDFAMEYKVNYLGEPRSTSLDGYIAGDYQIAIECKFTEADVGPCSRPQLRSTASNYETEYCNGTYSIQRARKERCSLTEVGILYWRYVSHLFKWNTNNDLAPCPLNKNYQLVRNILAAGVKSDGSVSFDNGHAVLIYDERNPSFQKGGSGWVSYSDIRSALQQPTMLRKCSWQKIVKYLKNKSMMVKLPALFRCFLRFLCHLVSLFQDDLPKGHCILHPIVFLQ